MLYQYLSSNEFRLQIEAIIDGFNKMKNGITSEKNAMHRIWKEREKQLEKVLINTSGLYGSVKGIAGASVSDIPLLGALFSTTNNAKTRTELMVLLTPRALENDDQVRAASVEMRQRIRSLSLQDPLGTTGVPSGVAP